MKRSSPRLPPKLTEVGIDELLDGELEAAQLVDADATNRAVTALELSDVRLEKILLTAVQCERVNARDVVIKSCDVSAANFSNGGWNRAEFTNCRMAGVDFSRDSLHDVVFKDCLLVMANFRFADLRRVEFINCTMTEADFLGAWLVDVSFEACQLEKTVFETATCTRVDLRTSELMGLVGWRSLKGASIDSVQLMTVAPYLAGELGIKVE